MSLGNTMESHPNTSFGYAILEAKVSNLCTASMNRNCDMEEFRLSESDGNILRLFAQVLKISSQGDLFMSKYFSTAISFLTHYKRLSSCKKRRKYYSR